MGPKSLGVLCMRSCGSKNASRGKMTSCEPLDTNFWLYRQSYLHSWAAGAAQLIRSTPSLGGLGKL